MPSSIKCTGFGDAKSALKAMQPKALKAFDLAVRDALVYLEEKAHQNLNAAVYDKTRPPFAPELTHELYNSWVHEIVKVGDEVTGHLENTSGHAGFLEWGTDDGGTGSHFVSAQNVAALHWIDGATGEDRFAARVEVHGIHPTHFL